MQKTILIGNKEVRMRASALIPRVYRFKFGRDMMADMRKLAKSYEKVETLPKDATEEQKEEAQFSALDLTIFENVAYIMAVASGENVPDTPDEWLDEFEMFSIYQVLPQILELWKLSNGQTATPKKK